MANHRIPPQSRRLRTAFGILTAVGLAGLAASLIADPWGIPPILYPAALLGWFLLMSLLIAYTLVVVRRQRIARGWLFDRPGPSVIRPRDLLVRQGRWPAMEQADATEFDRIEAAVRGYGMRLLFGQDSKGWYAHLLGPSNEDLDCVGALGSPVEAARGVLERESIRRDHAHTSRTSAST